MESARTMKIRVLAYDEQTLVRAGVRAVLDRENDIEVVDEAEKSHQMLRRARLLRPDVILLGLPVTDTDLVSMVRRLLVQAKSAHIVALVGNGDHDDLVEALRSGLRGVVRRDEPSSDLIRAIRTVVRGAAYITPSVAARLLDWLSTTQPSVMAPSPMTGTLSNRELQVLALVSLGVSDGQIAEELGVTTATVRSHMHHVLTKLEVRDRVQAVAFAYRHGLVGGSRTRVASGAGLRSGRGA
ncbi:response regulator transcription factor [Saccharothrix xinjiangensis]|uniref:LuxR C-terminal-related transcriptional regulator n=1 Tax=Saccharothrix xinjiangensis TaxID=204798 RepID=A0ABV9XXU9_9PSEU